MFIYFKQLDMHMDAEMIVNAEVIHKNDKYIVEIETDNNTKHEMQYDTREKANEAKKEIENSQLTIKEA